MDLCHVTCENSILIVDKVSYCIIEDKITIRFLIFKTFSPQQD